MSEAALSLRPYLFSYEEIKDLPEFVRMVRQRGKDPNNEYSYVTAAEKRCFNLIYSFYPNMVNLCSFQGLLTQYDQIVDYYRKEGRFPRILVVDDLIIHGKTLAKFFYRLKKLLMEALYPDGECSSEESRCFHRAFYDAIDIFVYAKTTGAILLEDPYLANLSSFKTLTYNELRAVSQQLSDTLIHLETASTSFSLSLWDEKLSELFGKEEDSSSGPNLNGWEQIIWTYEKEPMVLYIRASEERNKKWVSTVRLFPQRTDRTPQFCTSFSLIGSMEQAQLESICEGVCVFLDAKPNESRYGFQEMKRLLREKHSILFSVKEELIYSLFSYCELYDFASAVPLDLSSKPLEKTDVNKIARHFGCQNVIGYEKKNDGRASRPYPIGEDFLALLRDSVTVRELRAVLLDLIEQNAKPIPFSSSGGYMNTMRPSEKVCDEVNRSILRYFFDLAMASEEQAYNLANKPYLFNARAYQEFSLHEKEKATEKENQGGAILFNDLLEQRHEAKKRFSIPLSQDETDRCFLASYVFLMDEGIQGTKGYFTLDQFATLLVKAGELSMFYFPKLIAAFLPAFTYIEKRFNFFSSQKAIAIRDFYQQIRSSFSAEVLKNRLKELELNEDEADRLKTIQERWPDSSMVLYFTKILYRSGQNYGGWNNPNICHPDYTILFPLQDLIKEEAVHFMRAARY